MEDDGLPMRASGEWVNRKHHFLRRYCDMFTKGMHKKWPHLAFMDLMAGPGTCVIRESGLIVPGSPFVALDYDFDQYIFFESSKQDKSALSQRVQRHSKQVKCQITGGDWVASIMKESFHAPRGL